MKNTEEKIKELILPLITEKSYELYDVELKKEGKDKILRIFLDNNLRNISLDECAVISREISELLDNHSDLDFGAYMLEVSSPGLDRLLRNDGDFLWANGKTLKVKYKNQENKNETAEGKLDSFSGDEIILIADKKQKITIKKSSIESARRVMKFDELVPKKEKNK